MRNRRTKIHFPVFGYEVRVICARNLAATGRRLNSDLADAGAAFITGVEAPACGWLVLPLNPPPDMIAHEAAHAIRAIFERAGVSADDESFAYHLGYLVGRIHKFIKGKR